MLAYIYIYILVQEIVFLDSIVLDMGLPQNIFHVPSTPGVCVEPMQTGIRTEVYLGQKYKTCLALPEAQCMVFIVKLDG